MSYIHWLERQSYLLMIFASLLPVRVQKRSRAQQQHSTSSNNTNTRAHTQNETAQTQQFTCHCMIVCICLGTLHRYNYTSLLKAGVIAKKASISVRTQFIHILWGFIWNSLARPRLFCCFFCARRRCAEPGRCCCCCYLLASFCSIFSFE